MDVSFKDIAILEGCGDATKPGYDGAFVKGLGEQPAVYLDNGTCAGVGIKGANSVAEKSLGKMVLEAGNLSLEITYAGANSLDIVDLHGKIVFSGSAPGAHTYHVARKLNAGIYFAKISAGKGRSTRKLLVP
jgi:hypothetical protein